MLVALIVAIIVLASTGVAAAALSGAVGGVLASSFGLYLGRRRGWVECAARMKLEEFTGMAEIMLAASPDELPGMLDRERLQADYHAAQQALAALPSPPRGIRTDDF